MCLNLHVLLFSHLWSQWRVILVALLSSLLPWWICTCYFGSSWNKPSPDKFVFSVFVMPFRVESVLRDYLDNSIVSFTWSLYSAIFPRVLRGLSSYLGGVETVVWNVSLIDYTSDVDAELSWVPCLLTSIVMFFTCYFWCSWNKLSPDKLYFGLSILTFFLDASCLELRGDLSIVVFN